MELVSSFKLVNMQFRSILTLTNNTILGGEYQKEGNNYFIQFKINEQNEIKEIQEKNIFIMLQFGNSNFI